MRRAAAGFTLVEMMIAMAIFLAGAAYFFAAFSDVTKSSQTATVQVDLGSENKRTLTRVFAELQASSLTPQDTDGLDSTEPEDVIVVADDPAAPLPQTKAKLVTRTAGPTEQGGVWDLGEGKEQARERAIVRSKRLRFRKVVGYRFDASSGAIAPDWSGWITFAVNEHNQLVRTSSTGKERVVANRIDAFDVEPRPDGTVLVTTITAKPTTAGWKRYANAVTVHPKN